MTTQTAENNVAGLTAWAGGLWRLPLGSSRRALALVADRSLPAEQLQQHPAFRRRLVFAEQIHGASIAGLEAATPPAEPVPGCDALLTQVPGLALAIRTADCLPLFLWDPVQAVAGVAHAGWRGLAQHLPMRLIAMASERYHCRRDDLWIGIGPAIRACCYDVRDDFAPVFSAFLRRTSRRLTCDLPGYAAAECRAAGVAAGRIVDCGACTRCDPGRWHSVRAAGPAAGRLISVMMIRR